MTKTKLIKAKQNNGVLIGWATKLKILKIEYAWAEFLLCVLKGNRNMFLKINRSKIDDAAIPPDFIKKIQRNCHQIIISHFAIS